MFGKKKKSKQTDVESITNRVYIELVTSNDAQELCDICKGIPEDVYLKGYDDQGKPWQMNAKSYLGVLAMAALLNKQEEEGELSNEEVKEIVDEVIENNTKKEEKISIVDWNTIYVESKNPRLYTYVQKFAR